MVALCAFRKRWVLALAVLVTFSGISLLAACQIKAKYESEASLFVRLGRESAGLDPTATTSEITPIYETREQELNSALEVMQSRKLLEAVIGVIGEDVVLKPELFSFEAWQASLQQTSWPELNPDTIHRSNKRRELAVEAVYKAVTLEVQRSSSVIGVTSVAATPDLAQAITKTLLEAVRAEQVRLNQTSGLKFFQEQVATLQEKLDDARHRMTVRKNELGVMSIAGERARLEDVLTTLEKELNASIPMLAGARAAAEVMSREVDSLPDRTLPHDATDTLKKTLHTLQLKRGTLLTKFTPQHVRVRDLDTEIELVAQQLADPENRNAANPTLRELEVALATERSRVAETEARIEQLQLERSELLKRLTKLNDAEADMLALADREVELKAALTKATGSLEQARILDELSKEQISNIRVVQPPTFNPTSISPSRSMAALAGIIIAIIAAFILPAIVEFAAWYLRIVKSGSSQLSGQRA